MKLVVSRSTQEKTEKTGFLGRGPEQIETTFTIEVQLEDVDESTMKLLKLYTYVTQSGNRRPYTKLPIRVLSATGEEKTEELLRNHVSIEDLIDGRSWKADYLTKEFANIPYTIKAKIEEMLEDIKLGRLWDETPEEEIEIEEG